MLKIAVTGGIACGKSTLGSLMRETGVEVCEADDIVHSLLEEDDETRERVVGEFGRGVLDSHGVIDRAAVADEVFSSSRKLESLTSLLHPMVEREWSLWLEKVEAAGNAAVACVIVPLLYEAGMNEGWDAVICVAAADADCMDRLKVRGDSHCGSRMRLQMPVREKAARADYVIFNNGNETNLRRQWKIIYRSITENKYD